MRKTAVVLLTSLLLASLPVHGTHVSGPGAAGDNVALVVHDCPSQPGNTEPGVGTAGNGIETVWAGTGKRVLKAGEAAEPLVLVQTVVSKATETPPLPDEEDVTAARLALSFEAAGTEFQSIVRSRDDWTEDIAPVTGEDLLTPDWRAVREGTSPPPSAASYAVVEVGYHPHRLFTGTDFTLDTFEVTTLYDDGEGYVNVDEAPPAAGACPERVDAATAFTPPPVSVQGITYEPAFPDRTDDITFTPVLDVGGADPDWDGYSFSWTFHNGASTPRTSSQATPTLSFTELAPVTVELRFTNNFNVQSPAMTTPLTVITEFDNLAPVSDFTVSPRAPEVGDEVTFTDASRDLEDDDIVSWEWDFGDGTTSDEQSPKHTYTAAEAYNVTLTTTDEFDASNTRALTLFVCDETDPSKQACRAPNVGPQASFDMDANSVDEGGTITFTDTSTDPDGDGTIEAWHWDFGDGSDPATTRNPTHTFEEVGTFQVTLTVTDDGGLQATRAAPVRVLLVQEEGDDDEDLLPAPLAAFLVAPEDPVAGKAVTFTDDTTSETDLVSWTWFFGDGSSPGNGSEVKHTYQEAGTFLVRLTVTDERGVRDTTSRTLVVGTGEADEDAPGLPVVSLLTLLAVAVALRRRR